MQLISVVATSTKALFKGIDTWKKETIMKEVNLPMCTFKILKLNLYCFLLDINYQEDYATEISGSS